MTRANNEDTGVLGINARNPWLGQPDLAPPSSYLTFISLQANKAFTFIL